jgi:hypothetical protein
MWFCAFQSSKIFTSVIFHHVTALRALRTDRRNMGAYPDNCWIIRYGRRWLVFLLWCFVNSQILHIASSEYDVLVNLFRWGHLFVRLSLRCFSAFGSVANNILKGDCRLVGVDFM